MIKLFKKKSTTTALILSVSSFLFLAACNTTPKAADTKAVAEEHNDAKFNEPKNEKEAQFLVNAAEINLAEIKLSEMAIQNSKNAEVITLSKMLLQDHTEANKQLTALAKTKMITIPVSATAATINNADMLLKKGGNEFDKAYCSLLISEHKNAVQIFETANTDLVDVDIKQWASSLLPSLRSHLDKAITCEKNCEKIK
jgi:putative membrane protein